MLTANLYALKWGLSSVVDSISLAGTQCYNKLPMSVRKIRRPSIDLIKPHKESTNEDDSTQNKETEEKTDKIIMIEDDSTQNKETEEKTDKIIMMTSEESKNNESVQESKQEKTESERSPLNMTTNIYITPEQFKSMDPKSTGEEIYKVLMENIDEWKQFVVDVEEAKKISTEEYTKKNNEFTDKVCGIIKEQVMHIDPKIDMTMEELEKLLYEVVDENTINGIIQSALLEHSKKDEVKSSEDSNANTKSAKKTTRKRSTSKSSTTKSTKTTARKLNLENNVVKDDKKDEKEIKLNLIHYEDDVDENEKQEPKTTKRKTVSKNKAINGESVDPFSGQTVEL